MGFYGRAFIFNNVPSEIYNLYLGERGNSGETTTTGASDVSLLTQKLFRRPIPLYWGAEQMPVLQFPLSAYCPDDLTAPDYNDVSVWLWGQQNYHELRICQNDMGEIFYNCFLINPQITRIGNFIRAFTTTVICDSPFAWREPKTYIYTYSGGYSINDTIYFLNESANSAYTYPTSVIITANIFGGSVSIVNETDNDREFLLTLSSNEVVTLNCDTQQISSTTTTYPLYNFNLNWLRFLRGFNTLIVSGNITSLSITYPIAVKIG